jgi:hypothetical protein
MARVGRLPGKDQSVRE